MTRSLWALHNQMCRGEKDGGRANEARPNLCLSIKHSQLHPFSSLYHMLFLFHKVQRAALTAHHTVRQRIMNQRNALGYSRSGHGNRQVPVISTNNSESFRPKKKSNEDTDTFYTATRRKWQSGPLLSHHAWICEGTLRHNQGSDALSNSEIGSSD